MVGGGGGGKEPRTSPAEATEADTPLIIIYTSGTTGRPKGAVLTHGGFAIKTAHDFGFVMDLGESDRLFWLTDLGWLMGPMLIAAALAARSHRGSLRGRARLSRSPIASGISPSATGSP